MIKNGESADLTCPAGKYGTAVHITCANGEPDQAAPMCKFNCTLPTVSHGTLTSSTTDVTNQSTITLTCDPGYHSLLNSVYCPESAVQSPAVVGLCNQGDCPIECVPDGATAKAYVVASPPSGNGNGAILQFAISTDGTLVPATTAMVAAGPNAQRIALGPVAGSQSAYVTNPGLDIAMAGSVSQYAIGSTGSLVPLVPATASTGNQPLELAVSSNGKALIVHSAASNELSSFSIGAGGNATARPSLTLTQVTDLCAIDQTLYVTRANNNATVSQFAIDNNAALSPLTPAAVGTGNASAISCDVSGKHVYASGTSEIFQFSVGVTGGLSALSPASIPDAGLPLALAVDSVKKHLFAVNLDGTISLFTIGAGGELTAMTPASIPAGTTVPITAAFDPTGNFFYVVNDNQTISQYAVGATAVTPLTPATVSTGALAAHSIVTK